jgi:putative transposase
MRFLKRESSEELSIRLGGQDGGSRDIQAPEISCHNRIPSGAEPEGAGAFRPLERMTVISALASGLSYDSPMIHAPQEIRTYFVSAVTANRRRLFQVDANAELMTDVLQHYRAEGRFALHAFVIMPDHVHVLITPAHEVSLEKAVQFIKGGFSFRLKSKRDVWERSYNEVQILERERFEACKGYIEENPAKAGLCATAAEYMFSSARWSDAVDAMPSHFK